VAAAGKGLEFHLQRLDGHTVATTLKNHLVMDYVVIVRWEWTQSVAKVRWFCY